MSTNDIDKRIAHLEQFIKFVEKMMMVASTLEEAFEMQDVIFNNQIQLGVLILEKVRLVKYEVGGGTRS